MKFGQGPWWKKSCRPRPGDLGIQNLQLNEVQWYLDLIRRCKILDVITNFGFLFFVRFG
jgi:hypothetical protein